ncbi:MAG: hypothetical protein R3B48_22885 [Kofleriaceae bacterium]
MQDVRHLRLHHALRSQRGPDPTFDVVTYDASGDVRHVLDRTPLADVDELERFFAKVSAARPAHRRLGGAMLVAPRFEEAALDRYLGILRQHRSFRSAIDAWNHQEGVFRANGRDAVQVLLIEQTADQLRPLVFE